MGRKAIIAGMIVLAVLAATVSLASTPLRLYVNRSEIRSDVAPQIINGRTMVPIRWVAEALGARVDWDAATNSVSINLNWPQGLAMLLKGAALEFDQGLPGHITALWQAGGGLVLQHVANNDHSFHFCNTLTGKKTLIVPLIENARLTEITDTEIVFTAKGGGDCGAFEFPYRIRHDLTTGTQAREDLYLRHDGSGGAWPHTLKTVTVGDGTVQVVLAVAPDAVLAGGHRTPLTIARWTGRSLSLRMYDVTCSEPGRFDAAPDHPIIDSIQWQPLAAGKRPEDNALLGEDFPYGGMMGPVNAPSVIVTIDLKGSPDYNIVTRTGGDDPDDLELSYTVRFR